MSSHFPDDEIAGIRHEAYIIDPATSHILYANMPPFGMGEATRLGGAATGDPEPRQCRRCFATTCLRFVGADRVSALCGEAALLDRYERVSPFGNTP